MSDSAFIKEFIHGEYAEKNGSFYFISAPGDVAPSQHKDPTDQKTWSYWRKANYEFFRKELEGFTTDAVLFDIGAGESQFRGILNRFRAVAIDFFPYPGVSVICDLNKPLPFNGESADVLVLSNMLEHSAEPNTLLAECFRVLKPGGVMLGAVPFIIGIHQRPYDFYRYTDINLRYLFEKHGFNGVAIAPVTSLAPLVFMAASKFFTSLIRKTEFSKNRAAQGMIVFCLRALWKIVRVAFAVLSPVFKKCAGDEDLPLGYHFRALKSDR